MNYVTFTQVLAMSTRRTEHNKNIVKDLSNDPDGDTRINFGEDDETMVSSSEGMPGQGYKFESASIMRNREKHLRYRTRVFAAEYVMPFLYLSLFFISFFFFAYLFYLEFTVEFIIHIPHADAPVHILASIQCSICFSWNEMKCIHLH